MVRAPSISGRPTPQKKHKSSITSSSKGGGGLEPSSSSILPQRTTAISKSLKRAQKRAQLLSRTKQEENKEHIRLDGGTLSKSALRRRKRKARDELAKDDQEGRQGGISDLKDAMDELDNELQQEEEDEEDEGGEYSTGPLASNVVKGGRITTNHRKKVLQQEQARQKAILSNPTFQKSPFAALREHVRNSMVSQPARSR